MSDRIEIYRDSVLIADGTTAFVTDCPLADCEHALDIVSLARAVTVLVLDMDTKRRALDLAIFRQHASAADAIAHAAMAPQISTGKFDLKIWAYQGSDIHKFTSTGAAWEAVMPEECLGICTTLRYQITCPSFVYTIGAGTPITYSDAL